ncbi:MAG: hypothetical protein ACI8W8_003228 [Rhodothermales bacterium]|jgi:hypothetical protein
MSESQRNPAVVAAVLALVCAGHLVAAPVTVHNADELRHELHRAKPGSIIMLAPGEYGNGFRIERVKGTKEMPILIAGADEHNPPVFQGGNLAMHFVGCSYITLRKLRISGCRLNGINADDGGSADSPSIGMVFEELRIENIGNRGNHDSMKLSGLDSFTVRSCSFRGWVARLLIW